MPDGAADRLRTFPRAARACFLLALGFALAAGCARQVETGRPEELIAAAWNDYVLGEADLAIAKFEGAAAGAAEASDLHLQALYGLATTWNLRRPGEDPQKAREYYEQVITLAPDSDFAAWSRLGLARMKHLVPVGEDPDYAEVRNAYQQVIDRHPGHLAAEEAFIYLMATYISTLDPGDARYVLPRLEKFAVDPSHKFIGPAYSLIAVAHHNLGEHAERLQAEVDSLNNTEIDPTSPFTEFSWQYWNIATIAEFELGDFDTARTYYRKLIDEYPTDIRVYGCKQAIMRMDTLEQRIRDELAGRRPSS